MLPPVGFVLRNLIQRANTLLDYLEPGELFAALALRLYLAPIFWMAGTRKLNDMSSTIAWFGNADSGLDCLYLPFWRGSPR